MRHFCPHLQPSCSKWHLKQGSISKVLRQQSYQICHVQLSFKTPSLNHLLLIKITLSSTTQLTLMLNMWQRRCWDWIWHVTNHMWCIFLLWTCLNCTMPFCPFWHVFGSFEKKPVIIPPPQMKSNSTVPKPVSPIYIPFWVIEMVTNFVSSMNFNSNV